MSTGQVLLITGSPYPGCSNACADSVKCVVLNACYSEVQANAIAQHIDLWSE